MSTATIQFRLDSSSPTYAPPDDFDSVVTLDVNLGGEMNVPINQRGADPRGMSPFSYNMEDGNIFIHPNFGRFLVTLVYNVKA